MTIVAYGLGRDITALGEGLTLIAAELDIMLVKDIEVELEESLIEITIDDTIDVELEPSIEIELDC